MKRKSLTYIGALIFSFFLTGCIDDTFKNYAREEIPEGEPASVAFKVSIPAMELKTRSAGNDPSNKDINDLWIGIYSSKEDGKRLASKYLTQSVLSEGETEVSIDDLTSGYCYIVGVANPSLYDGFTVSTVGTPRIGVEKLLDEADTWKKFKDIIMITAEPRAVIILDPFLMVGSYSENETIEKSNDPTPVGIVPGHNTLPGKIHLERLVSYNKFQIEHNPNFVNFQVMDWTVHNVPATTYLQERLTVENENQSVNASDIEVPSWTSNAYWSQRHGRSYVTNSLVQTDLDHEIKDGNTTYFFDFYLLENKQTGIIPANLVEESNSEVEDAYYQFREKEWKIGEEYGEEENKSIITDGRENTAGNNTGWYKSLVAEPGTTIPAVSNPDINLRKNNATYVSFRVELEYYFQLGDENETPLASGEYDPQDPSFMHRHAEVEYTIHLGYCDGNSPLEKANDFNNHRNTQYSYNVTINGVRNVKLEVESEDGKLENQPGVEGTVTDIESQVYNLDSHYSVLNIQLSELQRSKLIWRIHAPFGDGVVDMVYGGPTAQITEHNGTIINLSKVENKKYVEALNDNQFYNWVQIRPLSTSDGNSGFLAHYPGDPRLLNRSYGIGVGNQNVAYSTDKIHPIATQSVPFGTSLADEKDQMGIWYLNALCQPLTFMHPEFIPVYESWDENLKVAYENFLISGELNNLLTDNPSVMEALSAPRYYTVFLDEYVYEYDWVPNNPSMTSNRLMSLQDWGNYIGKDDRQVWISVSDFQLSDDDESIYSKAAHMISQKSIQTYYNPNVQNISVNKMAIGVEHINESSTGNNLRGFTWNKGFDSDRSRDDEYWNQYLYITQPIASTGFPERRTWRSVIFSPNKKPDDFWGEKDESINTDYDNWQNISYDFVLNNHGTLSTVPKPLDEDLAFCMARNRDLNNNNIIEPNEIRWILPTTSRMSRIILGQKSLVSPLFDFKEFTSSEIEAGKGIADSHFIGSDKQILWAEELLAVGPVSGSDIWGQLRCIRNVGQEQNLEPNNDFTSDNIYQQNKVPTAYTRDRAARTITMSNYTDEAVRPPVAGNIVANEVGTTYAFASKIFKYAEIDYLVKDFPDITNDSPGWIASLKDNSICRNYHENDDDGAVWRVPNVAELTMMLYTGVLDEPSNLDDPENEKPKCYISSTQEYFTSGNYAYKRFIRLTIEKGKDNWIGCNPNILAYEGKDCRVRCVRDVIDKD